MKRKQDQKDQPIITSPWKQVTSKRTREINHHDNNNESTVSDSSSFDVESERIESNLNSNEYHLRSKNPEVVDDVNTNDIYTPVSVSWHSSNSPERLQQPPAYINPNLRKIKLESDYVPIVAVKQEPSTGDENKDILQNQVNNEDEDKKVDISSVSLDSSDTNINNQFVTNDLNTKLLSALSSISEFNADELPHLYYIIDSCREKSEGSQTQQQQEEEKVVVKVEWDENENREKETIAELEERISKYTKKVISLHREKTEIQTTLQNQTHQLNLIIGQHQTQVQDLQAIINLQLEEINRLKSQINHQPTRELNTELGLNSQNQDLVTSESMDQVKIKDFPTKVLSRIFDFLDIQSLKHSRFVSRQWKQEAGKILLKKYYVTIVSASQNNIRKCETALQNWLTNSYYATAKAQKLWSQDGKETAQLLRKFPTLRCSVRELKYNEKPPESENLYEILKLLPKLQVLETSSLNLSPTQKWLDDVDLTSVSNGIPNKLRLFMRKLQSLKQLKLDFVLGKSIAANFLAHHQRFAYIESLEIYVSGMSVINRLMRPNLHIWRITHFSFNLKLVDDYDVSLTRRFLTRISQSLQNLKLIINQDDCLSSSLTSISEPWIIPAKLDKLETLEIMSILPFSPDILIRWTPFMLKCIISALRLPFLKKLVVPFIPWNLEEIIHKSAAGGKLISESLEELELTSDFSSSTSSSAGYLETIPIKMWPGLKSLKCSWANPGDFDASILREFRVLGNFERLHLKIGYGMEQTADVKQCDKANLWQFNLSDLKNLKSFGLEAPANNPHCHSLAISLIESDLKIMKSLQCVQFHNIMVDGEPLKSALGPNVPVIFTK